MYEKKKVIVTFILFLFSVCRITLYFYHKIITTQTFSMTYNQDHVCCGPPNRRAVICIHIMTLEVHQSSLCLGTVLTRTHSEGRPIYSQIHYTT